MGSVLSELNCGANGITTCKHRLVMFVLGVESATPPCTATYDLQPGKYTKYMSTSKNYPLFHVKLSLLPQPHVTSWTLNHHFRFGGGSAPNKPQQLVWTSHHRPICCYSVPWQCEHQGFGPMGTNPPSLLSGFNPSKGNRRNSRNSKEWFSLNSSTVDVQRAAGVASWRADASLKICEEPPKR